MPVWRLLCFIIVMSPASQALQRHSRVIRDEDAPKTCALSFPLYGGFWGLGDRGSSIGGSDHEDGIWISFVLHRP
jgi:hypothetical protein